ncbi:acyltransferase family protein [Labrys neptuniae]
MFEFFESNNGRRTYLLQNLQGLRAIAAYMVVFHHIISLYVEQYTHTALTHSGAAGVDIFFAISGFIMVYTTRGRQGEPLPFLWRRLCRIAPLYWITTTLVFLACVLGMRPNGLGSDDGNAEQYVLSLLFIPFTRQSADIFPLVAVGWTLNYEMLFYLIFAVSLCLRNRIPVLVSLSVMLGIMTLTGLYWAAEGRPESAAAFLFTHPLLLEFLAGAVIAWAFIDLDGRLPREVFLVGGKVLIATGMAAFLAGAIWGNDVGQYDFVRPIVWGLPAAMIVAGAVAVERGGAVLSNRLILSQGAASYSIYLVHMLLLQAAGKIIAKVGLAAPPYAVVLLIAIFLVFFVGAVGTGIHLTIERPIGRFLQTLTRQRKTVGVP